MRLLTWVVALFVGSDAARFAVQELKAARLAADLTSKGVSGTPQSSATQSAATAIELVAAGQQAHTIVPRWHGAVSALSEVESAATSAQRWHAEVQEQVATVRTTLEDTDNGFNAALDGRTTYDEVRAITDGAGLLSVADDLLDATTKATQISALLGQLANTMVSATGLTERVDEVSDAWQRVDLRLVQGLEQRAQVLHLTFQTSSGALIGGGQVLHTHYDDWEQLGSWTQARRVYSSFDEMKGGYEQIGQTLTVINPAFDQLQQLATETAQAAMSLVVAARTVGNFRDRGVGSNEEVQRIFCEDRAMRTFGLNDDVDTRSMTCERYSVVGIQRCTCASNDDCYVTSEYRPAPASTKRCFRPV